MNAVERTKFLCKERGVPISKMEKDLGFANGYIGQLRKGVLPNDRAVKISNYFGVSIEYLTTGQDSRFSDENAHLVAKIRNDAELTEALKKYFELSDKKKKHVVETINLLSE